MLHWSDGSAIPPEIQPILRRDADARGGFAALIMQPILRAAGPTTAPQKAEGRTALVTGNLAKA